jgi:hypothetical protein
VGRCREVPPFLVPGVERPHAVMLAFRETYNTNWLIERHGFIIKPLAVGQPGGRGGVSDLGTGLEVKVLRGARW